MKYLSNSEMQDWRDCPRRWYLRYYRRLRRRDNPDFNEPTGIGNRVHAALEAYYDPGLRADPLAFVDRWLAEQLEAAPAFEADLRKEHSTTRTMLEGYLEWLAETGADQGLEVVAAETAMTAPLMEGVEIVSKLDLRVNHEVHGSRLAMDHKTVQSLDEPLPLLQLDTQMLTQHLVEYIAARDDGGIERARGVLYNMLKKSKRTARANGPFFKREPIRHNEHELKNHWRHVLRIAVQITDAERHLDAGVDHHDVCPPSPSRDCKWKCQFFKVCVRADDGSDFEGALRDLYVTEDPLERYRGLLPDLPRDDAAEE